MDIKNLEKIIPILQGIVEGKTLQRRTINNDWHNIPLSSIDYIAANPDDYRIKPNPKYRPFNNMEECWQEMLKHQPFGWVNEPETQHQEHNCSLIVGLDSLRIYMNEYSHTYDDAFNNITFADGSPFGILEKK